jgi:hypothetical protein
VSILEYVFYVGCALIGLRIALWMGTLDKVKMIIIGGASLVIIVVLELWFFEEEHGHGH